MTAILFNSLFPVVWIFVISILASILLSWLEIKRGQKLLIARIVALLVAIASLACLVLNPIRTVNKSSDIILLTRDFNKIVLDSLSKANPASQVYQLRDAEADNTIPEIKNYRDLDQVKGNFYILGQGLPGYMLDYVDTSAIQFYPASVSDGFIRVNTSKEYIANQSATVEGVFRSKTGSEVKLTGPGITEDSISLSTMGTNPFSLTFTPKSAGLYLYNLSASDSSGKVIHSELLPIKVKSQKALSILIVADYPSAEIRFLKNFLGTQNHKVVVRYKISKDKYRTEFANTDQRSIARLTESQLKGIDLLITDVSGFSSLSSSEVQVLKEAERFGLGVLTLLNTPTLPKPVKNYLELDFENLKSDSAQLLVLKKRVKIPATSIQLASHEKVSIIQQETGGRIISGYRTNGLGKSGFQLLDNTYVLELAGEKETYAQLWSGMIETLARKGIKKYDLTFTSPPPYYTDEPVEFKIVAAGEKPSVNLDSSEVSLAEDPLIKNVWYGKVWAGQTGWRTLDIKQDSSQHNFFVSPTDAWDNLRIVNQQRAIQRLTSQHAHSVPKLADKPVSPIVFFILFLLAAGFLWLAPKL